MTQRDLLMTWKVEMTQIARSQVSSVRTKLGSLWSFEPKGWLIRRFTDPRGLTRPTTQSTHCVPDQMLLYFKIQFSFTSTVNIGTNYANVWRPKAAEPKARLLKRRLRHLRSSVFCGSCSLLTFTCTRTSRAHWRKDKKEKNKSTTGLL